MRRKKERQSQVMEILRKTVSRLSSHFCQFGIGEEGSEDRKASSSYCYSLSMSRENLSNHALKWTHSQDFQFPHTYLCHPN